MAIIKTDFILFMKIHHSLCLFFLCHRWYFSSEDVWRKPEERLEQGKGSF